MVQVPYFDGKEVKLSESYNAEDPRSVAALEAFLKLQPVDRLKDSRHVHAYYLEVRDVVGGEFLDEEMGGAPEKPEDVWSYVRPSRLGVWEGDDYDPDYYVYIEAGCGWEEEHGLLMVWRNGETLNKVGGFDGHPTNEHAYDDERMRDVVYAGSSPEFTTRVGEGTA